MPAVWTLTLEQQALMVELTIRPHWRSLWHTGAIIESGDA